MAAGGCTDAHALRSRRTFLRGQPMRRRPAPSAPGPRSVATPDPNPLAAATRPTSGVSRREPTRRVRTAAGAAGRTPRRRGHAVCERKSKTVWLVAKQPHYQCVEPAFLSGPPKRRPQASSGVPQREPALSARTAGDATTTAERRRRTRVRSRSNRASPARSARRRCTALQLRAEKRAARTELGGRPVAAAAVRALGVGWRRGVPPERRRQIMAIFSSSERRILGRIPNRN